MNISRQRIESISGETGFQPDIVEKVLHLLIILPSLQNHPFLKRKFVLKGGTALNLFMLDVPRLSVDIDLNYIGAEDRDKMLQERPNIETALQAVLEREGFSIRKTPGEHAGGKYRITYQSSAGGRGTIEVDVNYMFRVPLFDIQVLNSNALGGYKAEEIPVLNKHELAAGKLAALFARQQARDLFDVHTILTKYDFNTHRLRAAFIVYGALNRRDWRTISLQDIRIAAEELKRNLFPMLRQDIIESNQDVDTYSDKLLSESEELVSDLLPFTLREKRFLDSVLDKGEIEPALLTDDKELQDRIVRQPMLQWKIQNVREHKGL